MSSEEATNRYRGYVDRDALELVGDKGVPFFRCCYPVAMHWNVSTCRRVPCTGWCSSGARETLEQRYPAGAAKTQVM